MSTETLTNDQAPASKSETLILIAIGLGLLYLLVGVVSYFWIAFQTPITPADLDASSWLAPQVGLQFHSTVVGGLIAVFAVGNLLSGRFIPAVVMLLAAACTIIGLSDLAALRVGILNGDAKIGCYSYESLECRRMLGMSEEGAQSIYLADKSTAGSDNRFGYADWYIPVRRDFEAKVEAWYPSTFPGIAILVSPFMLNKIDEINKALATQRAELAAQNVAPKAE